MKNMIAMTEKDRNNQELFMAMNNIHKTPKTEVAKVSSVIDFGNKYSWTISNADIDTARDQRLIGIKKY